jgi:type I restriction enzyme S subunit
MREGWKEKKLIAVCTLVNGRAYKKSELLANGKYPVLRVGNLFTNRQWYYSDLELGVDKYCDNGDLIYAWSASFGPRIWEGEKVIYHYHIWKVLPNFELVKKDFLFHLFEWDKEMIKAAHGTGTTMMHVGKNSMDNRVVPIPPLSEQKQIVALLDEAFAAIDQAKANIEKNIENAKELFQSKLNDVFSQKGDGWEEKSLGELGTLTSSKRIYKKEYVTEGIPF